MQNIIYFDFKASTENHDFIDVKSVDNSGRKLKARLIAPAEE